MMRQLVCAATAAAVLSGCATEREGKSRIVTKPSPTRLVIVERSDQLVLGEAAAQLDREEAILKECGFTTDAVGAKSVLVPIFVGLAVDFILSELEEALARELERYVKGYAAKATYSLYASGTTALSAKCFRFTRFDKVGSDAAPLVDLVGQFQKSTDHWKVRPLRLYQTKPLAKGNPLALAISMKAENVWLSGGEGKKAELFDTVLISEKIDSRADHPVIEYYSHPWEFYPALPLPAVSTDENKQFIHSGAVNLTVTAAEVGEIPPALKSAARTFKSKKGDIDSALNEAILKAFEDD